MKETKRFAVAKAAILEAANIVMTYYQQAQVSTKEKADKSPVTEADLAVNAFLLKTLQSAFPEDGFLTEEAEDNLERLTKEYVWEIDPIDGTKDFIHKTDEFTINIALVQNHDVTMGLVMAPAKNELFYALKGQGAYLQDGQGVRRIHVNSKTSGLTTLISRFHGNTRAKDYRDQRRAFWAAEKVVGASLKPCYIALGLYEHTIKLGDGLHEWDIAAPHLVLTEAGGTFIHPNGLPIRYNQKDAAIPYGYLAMNVYQEALLNR